MDRIVNKVVLCGYTVTRQPGAVWSRGLVVGIDICCGGIICHSFKCGALITHILYKKEEVTATWM